MRRTSFQHVQPKVSGNGKAGASDAQKQTRSRGGKKTPPQAAVLLSLVKDQVFFHAPDLTAFAVVRVEVDGQEHEETLPVKRQDFRNWLARQFYLKTKKAASGGILQDVLNVLEGRARYEGEQRNVWCRTAQDNGKVYIDLADREWRVVEVDAGGWRIVNDSPIHFRRPRGMLALPEPRKGGTLDELRPFLNLDPEKEDWVLVVGWLVQAIHPTGPYPVLNLHGEQGSAKSTISRVLRELIDPSKAPLRTVPRDERDLVIAASNSWLMTLDNLSNLGRDGWLSDALCRLSTGGGFATRELYTDSDEILLDVQRPVVLNGIEELALRPDLLDRGIVFHLPELPEHARRTEREFWGRFSEAKHRIFGALLTALSLALRHRDEVATEGLPRMADFAQLAEAAGRGLGWAPGTFLDAYEDNRNEVNSRALEASILYDPLRTLLAGKTRWQGTGQQLLEELTREVPEKKAKSRGWPKMPHVLSGMLRRIMKNLRKDGIRLEFGRDGSKRNDRIIVISVEQSCKRASEASESVRTETPDDQLAQGWPDEAELSDASDASDAETHNDSMNAEDDEILEGIDPFF
ncbi:MAG TPA: hypothetical protein VEL76_10845 [Gemmataceae bacterium]|nr:hypothetical protein [Gemmataceae bacterium]